MAQIINSLFQAGMAALFDYLSAHVLFCLVPAFFLAGAVNALVSKEIIVKTLGRRAKPIRAYGLAVLFGTLIEVCSCTVLPLFAGIWKRGAGLGPAIAFLYAGPAINILAVSYTASLLGWDIALARLVLSILFAVLVGFALERLFGNGRKEMTSSPSSEARGFLARVRSSFLIRFIPQRRSVGVFADSKISEIEETAKGHPVPLHQPLLFFGSLAGTLVAGTAPIGSHLKYPLVALLALANVTFAFKFYTKEELAAWMKETGKFFRTILPLLLVGVFGAGVFKAVVPQAAFQKLTGQNTVWANLAGVLFGVFAYFPALVEVPIAKTFLDLGMNRGPLLSYILADPIVSLQSLLVISRVLGAKKTITYAGLITVLTTAAGLVFGTFF